MLKKTSLVLIMLFLVACQPQSAPAPTLPLVLVGAPIEKPSDIPQLTATLVPTETTFPEAAATLSDPTSIFGSINAADAPVGFMLEPIAKVIFEAALQKRVDAAEIAAFQVEGLSIVPRGDGTFFAEIFYAIQADAVFWAEDFGTLADDGWVRGKCARFDFESTQDAYFLKNKTVCS